MYNDKFAIKLHTAVSRSVSGARHIIVFGKIYTFPKSVY